MNIVFRSVASIFLVSGLTACSTVYTHEAYDDAYGENYYERDRHYRPFTPCAYYRPYFYYVPYSDYYRY